MVGRLAASLVCEPRRQRSNISSGDSRSDKSDKSHWAPAVSAAAAMRAAAPTPRAGRAFEALTGAGRTPSHHMSGSGSYGHSCGSSMRRQGGSWRQLAAAPPGTHFWRLSLTAPAPEATRGSSLGIILWGGGAWRVEERRTKQHESPPLWCCCSTGTAAAAGDPVGARCSLPMSSLAGSVLGAT